MRTLGFDYTDDGGHEPLKEGLDQLFLALFPALFQRSLRGLVKPMIEQVVPFQVARLKQEDRTSRQSRGRTLKSNEENSSYEAFYRTLDLTL